MAFRTQWTPTAQLGAGLLYTHRDAPLCSARCAYEVIRTQASPSSSTPLLVRLEHQIRLHASCVGSGGVALAVQVHLVLDGDVVGSGACQALRLTRDAPASTVASALDLCLAWPASAPASRPAAVVVEVRQEAEDAHHRDTIVELSLTQPAPPKWTSIAAPSAEAMRALQSCAAASAWREVAQRLLSAGPWYVYHHNVREPGAVAAWTRALVDYSEHDVVHRLASHASGTLDLEQMRALIVAPATGHSDSTLQVPWSDGSAARRPEQSWIRLQRAGGARVSISRRAWADLACLIDSAHAAMSVGATACHVVTTRPGATPASISTAHLFAETWAAVKASWMAGGKRRVCAVASASQAHACVIVPDVMTFVLEMQQWITKTSTSYSLESPKGTTTSSGGGMTSVSNISDLLDWTAETKMPPLARAYVHPRELAHSPDVVLMRPVLTVCIMLERPFQARQLLQTVTQLEEQRHSSHGLRDLCVRFVVGRDVLADSATLEWLCQQYESDWDLLAVVPVDGDSGAVARRVVARDACTTPLITFQSLDITSASHRWLSQTWPLLLAPDDLLVATADEASHHDAKQRRLQPRLNVYRLEALESLSAIPEQTQERDLDAVLLAELTRQRDVSCHVPDVCGWVD